MARSTARLAIGPDPSGNLPWVLTALVVMILVTLPVVSIVVMAITSKGESVRHLSTTVLPSTLADTIPLLLGVGIATLIIGTATAWLVTLYRFPGRSVIDRLLVLPLAMPTYIVAYCYVELLDYAGPVQTMLRATFGWSGPRDYWFPEIRSLPGAILVMSAVLYPYVYLTARASFVQQSACALEVARTLGRTPLGVLRDVALPLARPALVAGAALAMMECLNDLGAVQYLGLQTLSVAISTTWLQRSDFGGAMQIASVLLLFVVALVALERAHRGAGKFHSTTSRYRSIPFHDLYGWRGIAAAAFCILPVVLGFAVPLVVLLGHSWSHAGEAMGAGYWQAIRNSVSLATATAGVAVGVALLLAYASRQAPNRLTRLLSLFAGLGYALPGTVLAIGLMMPFAAFDNTLDAWMRVNVGFGFGLMLSGSLVALVVAYLVRFLAVALGSIEEGLGRISPSLDQASRALGTTPLGTLFRVHLPILTPALGSAGLLVFVDTMKELPATLLLRPFNFETLATEVYNLAALEQFEIASISALTIVVVGLVPVLMLHKAVASGRAGS